MHVRAIVLVNNPDTHHQRSVELRMTVGNYLPTYLTAQVLL